MHTHTGMHMSKVEIVILIIFKKLNMTIISMNTETYPGSALVTFRNIKYINSNFKNKFSRILQLENFHFSF